MAILAKDLLKRAAIVLQDHENVRWSLAEMVGWFNDGQREIVLNKPNSCSETITLTLVAGTLQSMPDGYVSIIRLIRNIDNPLTPATGGKVVYMAPRDSLDATYVDWHTHTQAKRVKTVVYDAADPERFYVYPPNDGTGHIEAILSKLPVDITIPAAPATDVEAYTSTLGLPDIYANTILNYGLSRAYAKDAAVAGNLQRATMYYQMFGAALGLKFRAEMIANPNMPQPNAQVAQQPQGGPQQDNG